LSVRAAEFTERETQILELIARGCTDKEVALRLGISKKTVDSHLRRIFIRKGVHSRAAAIFAWLEDRRIVDQKSLSA
jgi:DNA-binding NarL/FixJ family response regulator